MCAVPFVLALALVGVGCGGGSGGEPAPISRAVFIARGSAICVATRRGIRSDFEAFTKSADGREIERAERAGELTPEEAAGQVGEGIVVPAMRRELEEFRALGVPPGEDREVAALLAAFEAGLEKEEGDPKRAAADGFSESGKVADGYGLEGC